MVVNVDSNFTVAALTDGGGGAGATITISGPGTLTVDRNSASALTGITNNTNTTAGTTRLSGNILIANTLGGTTNVTTANVAGNTVRFDTTSNLTLNSILQVTQGIGGPVQFNGTLAASGADLLIASNNVSFGTGHVSSAFGRDVVFSAANSKLTVTAGTVLNTGRKFQVNGNNSTLQLDGANTINGANIVVGSTNNFLIDANVNQTTMGQLVDIGGALTIDLDAAVTSLWFASSAASEVNWTGGSISITGFKENTIRFGTTASGLTSTQLGLITGNTYSLTSDGYLTAIPEPSAFAALAGLGALGFISHRRRRPSTK
jgi:hypothetical protein